MGHQYITSDGRILPSVTTILSDMIPENYNFWYANLRKNGIDPVKHLKELGIIGTICHYRVLSQISPIPIDLPSDPIDEYPEDIQVYSDLADMMWRETKLNVRRATCEQFEYDEKHGYCGTYDLKGRFYGDVNDKRNGIKYTFNGDMCIADIKTSKEAKEKHFIQLGGYANMIKEPINYGMVICLCPYSKKNPNLIPKIYVINKEELEMYKQMFLKLCDEWWLKHGAKNTTKN